MVIFIAVLSANTQLEYSEVYTFYKFTTYLNVKNEASGRAPLRSSNSNSVLPIGICINPSIASLLFNESICRLVFQQKGLTDPKYKSN